MYSYFNLRLIYSLQFHGDLTGFEKGLELLEAEKQARVKKADITHATAASFGDIFYRCTNVSVRFVKFLVTPKTNVSVSW
jgi:hypothetical protein